ncbi:hypothetical protein BD410DRAFT_589929 [Rickenella mellea]|uniref:RING-type domain-containing protein n=1 Tax=Rickenella mellea TaxID=50990 RepID=A0A4Y7PN91_9AGAM|nr:hypothetical protein BD410DRAFT_589929 [Rickenella mellea]
MEVAVGSLRLRFMRTVRMDDNSTTNDLPPGFGPFPIHTVSTYAKTVPPSLLSRGGRFISMWKHEAMWMLFDIAAPQSACAVRIYVGGINALTGQPRNATWDGKQDYLAVKAEGKGQRWLDGISVKPGVVRQFVTMPQGQGHTVEGQITGEEDVGGVQINVCELYEDKVSFKPPGLGPGTFDRCKTPHQLGLKAGDIICMKKLLPRSTLKDRLKASVTSPTAVLRLKAYRTLVLQWRPKGAKRVVQKANEQSQPTPEFGIAAGGLISQKIHRDNLPALAYDMENPTTIHISIINPEIFKTITGRDPLPSPITQQMYEEMGLPWFKANDQEIPSADNFSVANPLAQVQSISSMGSQTLCTFCKINVGILSFSECFHTSCEDCATHDTCPSCN